MEAAAAMGYAKVLYIGLAREQHAVLRERGQLEPFVQAGTCRAD